MALAAPGSRPWGVRPGSAGVRGSGVAGSLSAAVTRSVLVSSSPLGIWPHNRPSVLLQTPSSGSPSHTANQGPLRSPLPPLTRPQALSRDSQSADPRVTGAGPHWDLQAVSSGLARSALCLQDPGSCLRLTGPASWGSGGPWGWMGGRRGDALAAQTAGRDTESGVCTQGSSSHPRGLL